MGFIAVLLFIKQLILCQGGIVVVQIFVEPGKGKSCAQILRRKLHIPFKSFRRLPAVSVFQGQLRIQKQRFRRSFIQLQGSVKQLLCPVPVSAHHIYRCRFQTEPGERFIFQTLAEFQRPLQIARRFLILFFRYGKIGQQVVCFGGALGLRLRTLCFFSG